MVKNEKMKLNLCLLYIMFVFMYGMVIKLTMSNNILFQVKTYIPEMMLGLIAVLGIWKNGLKIKPYLFILLFYSIIVLVFNICVYGLNQQGLYCMRDIYIPLVAFCFIGTKVSEEAAQDFSKKLVIFLKCYLIVGLFLAIMQQIKGWEWTSAFYTGYSFYGQDPVSKIKIAHNFGLLRSPSLSGNFATFGYYCLIASVYIAAYTEKKIVRIFWDIITVACMVLATNKSAVVAFGIILLLRQTVEARKKSTKVNNLIIILLIGLIGISTLFLIGDNTNTSDIFASLFERINVWKEILAGTSFLEVLFPYKQFTYGSGVEGGLGFWDNTYLYFLFTQGIVGTILWVQAIKRTYNLRMKEKNISAHHYVYELTVVLLVLGLTVNVTQGRGFLAPYLVLISANFAGGGVLLYKLIKNNLAVHFSFNDFKWRCIA